MSGVIFGLMHSSTNLFSALDYVTMCWILAYVYVHTKNLFNILTLLILFYALFISVFFNLKLGWYSNPNLIFIYIVHMALLHIFPGHLLLQLVRSLNQQLSQ